MNEQLSPGQEYQVNWDGTDDAGNVVASGLYIYTLQSRGYVTSRKLMMLR
ncbi:MAG: hypothetical protein GWN00_10235 [Aliifodinibius sp.]|nr:hypothetical protein [Fodinibius sp.]NIV11561.1 hypothetical protein [Fodinibius sp.]NIY25167.1 hypothetical protein [Fodinibius sp.]